MNRHHHLKISLAAALMAVCLFPFSALASENVVESAPEVSLPEITMPEEAAETISPTDPAYLPSQMEYIGGDPADPNLQLRRPRLTDREMELYDVLMANLKEGKAVDREDLNYVNRTEQVLIGVYPLDPAEYDGETYYVLLPPVQLGMANLLGLVRAFEELGLTFDPASLNVRNCSRGYLTYGRTSTRYLSYEENRRMQQIRRQIHRGILEREDIPQETTCFSVETTWSPQETLRFHFYPYRSMTDNELAAFAFLEETAWDTDPDLLEAESRNYARSILRFPLSMTCTEENMESYVETSRLYRHTFEFTYGDPATGNIAYPGTDDPVDLTVWHTINTEENGSIRHSYSLTTYYTMSDEVADDHPGFTDEDWIAAAKQWASQNLMLPADRQPDSWQVVEMGSGSVILTARTHELVFDLSMNIQDVYVEYIHVYSADEAS